MNWATRKKNRVHVITPIVEGILSMSNVRSHQMVAKVVGCSVGYVQLIRKQYKSSAHIFLTPEENKALK